MLIKMHVVRSGALTEHLGHDISKNSIDSILSPVDLDSSLCARSSPFIPLAALQSPALLSRRFFRSGDIAIDLLM